MRKTDMELKILKMDFLLILLAITGSTVCVEVHFENKDSGFFLKHTARSWAGGGASEAAPAAPPGAVLSVDRFTVLQPAAVRATYGPFSTKQTVPARRSVPDAPAEPPPRNASAAAALLHDTRRLDVSAHAVTRELARDSPVLRVLFHAGAESGGRRAAAAAPRSRRVCVALHATLGARSLSATCSPDGEEGACLAELTLPAEWWGPLPAGARGDKAAPAKQPPRAVRLSYGAAEAGSEAACGARVSQPAWPLGAVTLVGARAPYRELRSGPGALLLPRAPLYPRSRMHLPFVVRHEPGQPITHVLVKARVKSALRLLSAAASNGWALTAELKSRAATVTATRRADAPPIDDSSTEEEVFTWLIEVGEEGSREGGEARGAGRLVWSAKYGPAPTGTTEDHSKVTARLDIEKDDIQAVLPISKNWEVLNTAVLTGRQVSQAMKVLIVSQAGQVADVTLQSSCHSEDESVLKVSSSCSSVYVDGSEIRGSSNASVIVKYGTYTGLARFTVWMPEFPLEVDVDDFRLSQIKGWKIADDNAGGKGRAKRSYAGRGWTNVGSSAENGNSLGPDSRSCRLRYQQSPVEVFARFMATDHDSGRVSYFVSRRTWLKVTDLVLTLMRVSDPRIATLHGKILQGRSMGRTEVQVLSPITGRVIGAREIRVVSDKVTILKLLVRVISGLQLNISPDSVIENGYISETTVTRRLTAQYQEGLLDIYIEFSDGTKTPLRDVAVTDYFLLVESLDTEVVAFAPMVASHHPRVIAVGEGNGELLRVTLLTSEECRVGPIRRLTPQNKSDSKASNMKGLSGALATASATVDVDFTASDIPQRPDTPQNDDIMNRGASKGLLGDLNDILIGIPLKDENNHEPSVQARQHGSLLRNIPARGHGHSPNMTPVEIGMYVLLGAFCFAIVIFVVSCVVYASKFKPMSQEPLGMLGPSLPLQPVNGENGKMQVAGLVGTTLGFGRDKVSRESTTNAHDWVWLGRATIERNNGNGVNRNSTHQNKDSNANCNTEMRITNNPLNYNYVDPNDALKNDNGNVMVTSFENPNHIELPSQVQLERGENKNQRAIDTTTYCKRPSRHTRHNSSTDNGHQWQVDPTAPPLPPHGIPLEARSLPASILDASDELEYKPPVPPHRNITTTTSGRKTHTLLADTIMPPTRRNHSKYQRKSDCGSVSSNNNVVHASSNGQINAKKSNDRFSNKHEQTNISETPAYLSNCSDAIFGFDGAVGDGLRNEKKLSPVRHDLESMADNLDGKDNCSRMFEFDNDIPVSADNNDYKEVVCLNRGADADNSKTFTKPQSPDYMRDSGIGLAEVQLRPKPQHCRRKESNREYAATDEFVELSDQSNGGFSTEVKRATIVGNPMYSLKTDDKIVTDDVPTESLGLDDLEMDYDQIMHYFHNLKESNA